jgi:hypothetical protein
MNLVNISSTVIFTRGKWMGYHGAEWISILTEFSYRTTTLGKFCCHVCNVATVAKIKQGAVVWFAEPS